MNYSIQKKFAIKQARESGKILMKYFKKVDRLEQRKKNLHEIVTPADLAVNEHFIKAVKKNFPAHGILSEETGYYLPDAEYVWVIDPLDGTTNFSLGNPFFNTSIALIHRSNSSVKSNQSSSKFVNANGFMRIATDKTDKKKPMVKDAGEIVLGVIYAPTVKQLFVAEKGKGIKLNNRKINVSSESKLEDSIVNFGYSYRNDINKKFMPLYKKLMMNIEHTRNMGAAALELAWVAMGRLESYILFDVKLWDVAAGVLMIREAGGEVTDFQGKEFTIESDTVLATNGKLHGKLLRIINKNQ